MTQVYMAVHALLMDGPRFLVTRRSSLNTYMPLIWDLPGGHVEVGETIEQALAREVTEETSLAIAVVAPVFVHTNLAELPRRQTFQLVYRCERLGGEIRLNPEEHDAFAWVESFDETGGEPMPFLAALLDERCPGNPRRLAASMSRHSQG